MTLNHEHSTKTGDIPIVLLNAKHRSNKDVDLIYAVDNVRENGTSAKCWVDRTFTTHTKSTCHLENYMYETERKRDWEKWSKNLTEIRKWTGLFNEVSRINATTHKPNSSCAFGLSSNYVDKMISNFELLPTEMVSTHFWRPCSTTATPMTTTTNKGQLCVPWFLWYFCAGKV